MQQKILILVNTGTPDAPDKKSVRKYLSEFLNDPLVVDLPWLLRKILVNMIIVPFRTPVSAKLYKRLWTEEGSPLKINLEKLSVKLQNRLKGEYRVKYAMRYGNPSVRSVMSRIEPGSEITVLPLFPQYASATTGTVINALQKEAVRAGLSDSIRFIDHFYAHPLFINSFSARIKSYKPETFDHVIFSYHSLPVRQVLKMHPGIHPDECNCEEEFPADRGICYKAACYQTTRLIAQRLGLHPGTLTTTFQSRLSKNWIGPFIDQVIRELAAKDKKRILVAAPSFVSDCLETLIEIKEDYRKTFIESGGIELVYAESLNYDDCWVDALSNIIRQD